VSSNHESASPRPTRRTDRRGRRTCLVRPPGRHPDRGAHRHRLATGSPGRVLAPRSRPLPGTRHLERAAGANLAKLNTALRLLADWAQHNGLTPSETVYVTWTPDRRRLRFTKTGDEHIERGWRTHRVSPALAEAKRARQLTTTSDKPVRHSPQGGKAEPWHRRSPPTRNQPRQPNVTASNRQRARRAADPDVEWSILPFFTPRTKRHIGEIRISPGWCFRGPDQSIFG
jgi:hypothetical protein